MLAQPESHSATAGQQRCCHIAAHLSALPAAPLLSFSAPVRCTWSEAPVDPATTHCRTLRIYGPTNTPALMPHEPWNLCRPSDGCQQRPCGCDTPVTHGPHHRPCLRPPPHPGVRCKQYSCRDFFAVQQKRQLAKMALVIHKRATCAASCRLVSHSVAAVEFATFLAHFTKTAEQP
jgi:hypothetical protein